MKTKIFITYEFSSNPTSANNMAAGYGLGQYWRNTTTGEVFNHKTNGVWVQMANADSLATHESTFNHELLHPQGSDLQDLSGLEVEGVAQGLVTLHESTYNHLNIPTTEQRIGFDLSPISSTNRALALSDIVGGLPTGEIPNSFVNYDSDISGIQSTDSETWVDITGMDLEVDLASTVPIRAQFNYTCSKSRSNATVIVAFRVRLLSPDLASIGMQSSFDNSDVVTAVQNGGVNFRTPNLPAGTYTFRPQFRMVSGNGSVQLIRGQFFVQAQQAPKGVDGYTPIKGVDYFDGDDGVSAGTIITWALSIGVPATIGVNKTNVIIAPIDGTLSKVVAICKTAPIGDALIFDILKNGTSIWDGTPENRIRIPIGSTNVNTVTTFSNANIKEGDILSINIEQIGSTLAGQDITIQLIYK